MCDVYTSRTITGTTLSGGSEELIVWLRTQYVERIHIIGLELPEDSLESHWLEPYDIIEQMIQAIKDLTQENPCVLTQLYFESKDPGRVRLFKILFKMNGYTITEKYPDIYKVEKVLHP